MKAGFVGTGGLGGQRYANALGQSMADTQASLTGQQYGALSKGYSEALKGALDEANLRNNAAINQQKIADAEQLQGISGASALTKAGAERQSYQQSLLDAPLKTATSASNLLRGYTQPTTKTETFVGPKAGLYQLSDLDKVAGTLSTLGGIASGSGLNTIQSVGTNLGNYLKGLISGNSGITGGLTVDPTEFAGQNAAGTPVYYDTTTGQYYDTSGNIIPISGGEGE